MKSHILIAIRLTLIMLVLLVVVYPLVVAGIARFAPGEGRGETISVNGKVVGYANIGQAFTRDDYFQGRPSAVDYNAAGSAGSNKGPSNPDYLKTVQARIDTFLVHNPTVQKAQIPVELVTASGSGLDPDISSQGAYVQVPRIAKARDLPETAVISLLEKHIEGPLWGVFGPSKVNVLKLNVALDALKN